MEKINKFNDLEREKIVNLSREELWNNSKDSNEMLSYLRNRGLTDDIIKEFHFGYCPAGIYHILAGRIIMPLYDIHNKLISITSRHTKSIEYKHWHESFDKGKYLYGINAAKHHILKSKKAIVVEGQFDVTCLHSYGFKQTVGVLGSSLSIFHVNTLTRLCDDIFIVLDPDGSGEAGVQRTLEMALLYRLDMYGLNIIPVTIPDKLDPDEFVMQSGAESFVSLLKKAKERVTNGRRI